MTVTAASGLSQSRDGSSLQADLSPTARPFVPLTPMGRSVGPKVTSPEAHAAFEFGCKLMPVYDGVKAHVESDPVTQSKKVAALEQLREFFNGRDLDPELIDTYIQTADKLPYSAVLDLITSSPGAS